MTAKWQDFFWAGTDLQVAIHNNARDHGWWDEPRSGAEIIALIHSELSEALEAMRHGDPKDTHLPDRPSVEVELADAIIRILDYAEHEGLDVLGAVLDKHEYNKKRPYKHGKKF